MCNFEKCQNDQESWTVLQQNKSVCILLVIEIKASSYLKPIFCLHSYILRHHIFFCKTYYLVVFIFYFMLKTFHVEFSCITQCVCIGKACVMCHRNVLRESKQVANLGSANYSSTRLNFLYGLIFNLVEYVIKTVALTTIDE